MVVAFTSQSRWPRRAEEYDLTKYPTVQTLGMTYQQIFDIRREKHDILRQKLAGKHRSLTSGDQSYQVN